MKKNGFTLAEVMGVVIILGVILLLTLPTIDKTIKNTRQTAYDAQINNIIKAASDWTIKNPDLLPTIDGNSIIVYLGELKRNGDVSIDLRNPKTKKLISNNTSVVITRKENKFTYQVDIVDATGNEDTNAPVLVINGDIVDYVEVNREGAEYVVPTATAKAADGTSIPSTYISYQILKDDNVVSRVDTSKLGTYTLNYTVTYEEKTSNYQKKVVVRDTTNPEISIGKNLNIANDKMDINLLAGVNVTDNSGEEIVPIVRTTLSNIDGIYSIFYTATDSSGNSITKKREVTIYTPLLREVYKENIIEGNDPKLENGLIPVMYKDNEWVVASKYDRWYDYSNQKWANAIAVKEVAKADYVEGHIVKMDDVLAFMVWIPRFNYNIPVGSTSDNSMEIDFVGIDKPAHRAFTIGGKELFGFWIGKFETGGLLTNVRILPNVEATTKQKFVDIFNVSNTASQLGLSNTDGHMTLNTEWGAVAYLTQSLYGRCNHGCIKMYMNNSTKNITGIGGDSPMGSSGTYETEDGQKASTTGNIYGVYDMAGGLAEITSTFADFGYKKLKAETTSGLHDDDSIGASGGLTVGIAKTRGLSYLSVWHKILSDSSLGFHYYYLPCSIDPARPGDATIETSGYWDTSSVEPSKLYPYYSRGGENSDSDANIFKYKVRSADGVDTGYRLTFTENGFDQIHTISTILSD